MLSKCNINIIIWLSINPYFWYFINEL